MINLFKSCFCPRTNNNNHNNRNALLIVPHASVSSVGVSHHSTDSLVDKIFSDHNTPKERRIALNKALAEIFPKNGNVYHHTQKHKVALEKLKMLEKREV